MTVRHIQKDKCQIVQLCLGGGLGYVLCMNLYLQMVYHPVKLSFQNQFPSLIQASLCFNNFLASRYAYKKAKMYVYVRPLNRAIY